MELCFLYSRTIFFMSLYECDLRIKGVVEAEDRREEKQDDICLNGFGSCVVKC